MKKIQNYYMKPQELKKKLQNPKFRSTFAQWSKSNISVNRDMNSKNNRSKSPLQVYQKSLNGHRKSTSNYGKQNIRPNSSINRASNSKLKVTSKQKGVKQGIQNTKKRAISTQSHYNKNYQSNKSLDKNYISNLSAKHRYNSCSSIVDYKKKQRCNSSVDQQISKKQKEALSFQLKYSYRTKQGTQITNPHKTNQDSLLIKTQLNNENTSMFAVADGHGLFGHMVSQYLVKNLSKQIEAEMKKNKALIQALPTAYNKLQQGLTASEINAACSGSTLVNVIVQKEEIVCANVGDSRAILARQIDRKNWEMIYLSQDHKPVVEGQKKRIIKNGGKIHAFKDEKGCPVGPQRVWLPNQHMQGLAMSRSFGDNVSKPIGVTHIPEIIRLKIDKRDRFILLASDGIWEFISNQEVLQLLVPFYREGKLQQACDALVNLAYQRWTVEDKSIVDDITLILIFFTHSNNQK